MNDTAISGLPAGCATYLSVADHNVVMTGSRCFNSHLPEHQQHHVHETVEGKAHVILTCHKRQHQVVLVGIHTASPTLPLIHLDAILTTIVQIHLILHHLITPVNHAGLYLPHKEAAGLVDMTCHIFLHRQVERQATHLHVRQIYILHYFGQRIFFANV